MSHCQSGNPEVSSLESDKTSNILDTAKPRGNSCESTDRKSQADK